MHQLLSPYASFCYWVATFTEDFAQHLPLKRGKYHFVQEGNNGGAQEIQVRDIDGSAGDEALEVAATS